MIPPATNTMIHFPCRCRHRFSLPDDQAGNEIQCPKCGLLNDIPTPNQLRIMESDGTFRINPVKAVVKTPTQPQRPPTPKYDPETGQLLQELPLKPPDPQVSPLPGSIPLARVAVGYATGATVNPFRGIAMEMFMPANAAVVVFVWILHALIGGLAALLFPALGTAMLIVAGPPGLLTSFIITVLTLGSILLAHYGNTIDETGPENHDELPRPLRYLSWRDDFWYPAWRFNLALLLCYWPALFTLQLNLPRQDTLLILIATSLLGTLPFPAVLLTTITAGALRNLRPDRILGVILISGSNYFKALLLWILSLALYAASAACLLLCLSRGRGILWLGALAAASLIAVWSTHLFCWYLGLIYRAHAGHFNWILQRHTWLPPGTKR